MTAMAPKTQSKTQLIIRLFQICFALYYLTVVEHFLRLSSALNLFPFSVPFLFLPYAVLIALLIFWPLNENTRQLLLKVNLYFSFFLLMLFIYFPLFVLPLSIYIHMMNVLFVNYEPVQKQYVVSAAPKKILLIDDDLGMHKLLTAALGLAHYEVFSAHSGEEGLAFLKLQKPDAIILDVILPGIKGREVCARLKKDPATKSIPILFLTSKDHPDEIKAEMDLGAAGHLTKPINPQHVVGALKKFLG